MASAKELQAQLDAAHQLMTERGVPIVPGVIVDRIEVLLDAKRDVERDLEFETGAPIAQRIKAAISDEHSASDRALAEAFIAYGTLANPIIETILEPIMKLAAVKKLTEFQQKDLIDSVSARVRAQLQVAMKVMAAADHPTLSAKLVDFTTKGSTVKIKLETVKSIDNLTMLGRIGEGQLDIVFTDIKAIDDGSAKLAVQPEKDQPDLPIEAAAKQPEPVSGEEADRLLEEAAADEDVDQTPPPAWGEDVDQDQPEEETQH